MSLIHIKEKTDTGEASILFSFKYIGVVLIIKLYHVQMMIICFVHNAKKYYIYHVN
jgi:hypothetical protein